jgi:hypothetical protein
VRVLKASEIGSFVYCRRAWWYQRQGVATQNVTELANGRRLHDRHGWQVQSAGLLQRVAAALLALAVLLFGLYLFTQAA